MSSEPGVKISRRLGPLAACLQLGFIKDGRPTLKKASFRRQITGTGRTRSAEELLTLTYIVFSDSF